MTILPDSFPLSQSATENAAALTAAATAACELLPAATPLVPGTPQPGNLGTATAYAGAAIATFEGLVPGAIAVLVGSELVQALASSPLGSLDLAAASQPALDGAAEALGARVGAAQTVPLDLVVNDLGFPFTVVPLTSADGTTVAALLVNDTSLETAAQAAAANAAASVTAVPTPTFATGPSSAPVALPVARGLEMLHGVVMDVTVELGRTRMSVRELLALTPGTVLELDRAAGSPADLLVNGRLIARGEVVVVDEDFGLRVTEIVDDSSAAG
ncbi:MAG TPA: flagellar motor switch protein FliN [Marmoricola sp.]|nr:flagellar motor switch protein FliN [Marmoricola sp.]